jgi:hypothetical protein
VADSEAIYQIKKAEFIPERSKKQSLAQLCPGLYHGQAFLIANVRVVLQTRQVDLETSRIGIEVTMWT